MRQFKISPFFRFLSFLNCLLLINKPNLLNQASSSLAQSSREQRMSGIHFICKSQLFNVNNSCDFMKLYDGFLKSILQFCKFSEKLSHAKRQTFHIFLSPKDLERMWVKRQKLKGAYMSTSNLWKDRETKEFSKGE